MFLNASFLDRVKDDYLANRILRDDMRVKRKVIKARAATDGALLKKSSLDMELVPEHQDDIRAASLLRLQTSESSEDREKSSREVIENESIFKPSPRAAAISDKREQSRLNLKSIVQKQRQKEMIAKTCPLKTLGVIVKKKKIDPGEEIKEEGPEDVQDKSKDGEDLEPASKVVADNPEPGGSGKSKVDGEGGGIKPSLGLSLCDYGSTSSESE